MLSAQHTATQHTATQHTATQHTATQQQHSSSNTYSHQIPATDSSWVLEVTVIHVCNHMQKSSQPPFCCVCFDIGHIGPLIKQNDTVSIDNSSSAASVVTNAVANRLLVCSIQDCDVAVHPVPMESLSDSKQWKCDWCLSKQSKYKHDSGVSLEVDSDSPVLQSNCVLCPNSGGALKLLHNSHAWAHLSCALWIPEIQFTRPHSLSGIDIKQVHSSRWDKYCHLCSATQDSGVGACLGCAQDGCDKWFHVTCALKWNLVQDSLLNVGGPNDVTMVPRLLCHEHCRDNDNHQGIQLHAWEEWRLTRQKALVQSSELDMLSGQFADVEVVDQTPYSGNSSVNEMSKNFQEMYIAYDNQRANKIHDMYAEYELLIKERSMMETDIQMFQAGKSKLCTEFEEFDDQVTQTKKECQDIQRSLMSVFECGKKKHWDWSVLVPEIEQSTRIAGVHVISPVDLDSSVVTEFFLQYNPQVQKIVGCPVNFKSTSAELLNKDLLPNLSLYTGAITARAPPPPGSHQNLNICDSCHTRLLPMTAPVLPKYRDTLITCCQCKSRFHLVCVEPMLNSLPEQGSLWQCGECLAGRQPMNASYLSLDCIDEDESCVVAKTARKRAAPRPRVNSNAASSQPPRRRANALSSTQDISTVNTHKGAKITMAQAMAQVRATFGPCPQPPDILFKQQPGVDSSELILRAPVFDNLDADDRLLITRIVMWRLVCNIPRGADTREIAEMIEGGKSCEFGSFALAFDDYVNDPDTQETEIPTAEESIENIGAILAAEPIVDDQHAREEEATLREMAASFLADPHLPDASASMESIVESIISPVEESELSAIDDDNDSEFAAQSEDEYVPAGTSTRNRGAVSLTNSSESVNIIIPADEEARVSGSRPERQPSQWDGDLYKPFWTRGYGKQKEGWCGLCKPGIWLKTKTSVYWYHMHNFHGISSIAGNFFTPPCRVRVSPDTGMSEGLCYQCKKWIALQSDKPVNIEEIYWFKHAQKCHKLAPCEDVEFDIELVPGQRSTDVKKSVDTCTRVAGDDEDEMDVD